MEYTGSGEHHFDSAVDVIRARFAIANYCGRAPVSRAGWGIFDRSLLRHSFAACRPHPEDSSGCAFQGREDLSDHLREYASGVCVLVYLKFMRFAPFSGLVGAIATTALNETSRRFVPYAPRLDVLGLRLASAGFRLGGLNPPRGPIVRVIALIGDLVSNSLFFGLIGLGRPDIPWFSEACSDWQWASEPLRYPNLSGSEGDTTARTKKTAAQTILFMSSGECLRLSRFKSHGEGGIHERSPHAAGR